MGAVCVTALHHTRANTLRDFVPCMQVEEAGTVSGDLASMISSAIFESSGSCCSATTPNTTSTVPCGGSVAPIACGARVTSIVRGSPIHPHPAKLAQQAKLQMLNKMHAFRHPALYLLPLHGQRHPALHSRHQPPVLATWRSCVRATPVSTTTTSAPRPLPHHHPPYTLCICRRRWALLRRGLRLENSSMCGNSPDEPGVRRWCLRESEALLGRHVSSVHTMPME